MNPLTKVPERLRGWFYLGLSVVLLAGLVAMFVIAVLNGDDLSAWLPILLGGLGLGGAGMAASNTSRQK